MTAEEVRDGQGKSRGAHYRTRHCWHSGLSAGRVGSRTGAWEQEGRVEEPEGRAGRGAHTLRNRTGAWGAEGRGRPEGAPEPGIRVSVHCRGTSRGATLFTFRGSPHTPSCPHTTPVPGRQHSLINEPDLKCAPRAGTPVSEAGRGRPGPRRAAFT